MPITQQDVLAQNLSPTVTEAARALARAIAESPAFRRFEVAQEKFTNDTKLQQQLADYQAQQKQAQLVSLWDGAQANKTINLEQQWNALLKNPVLTEYLDSEAKLRNLLRDATAKITQQVGIDYGAACTPAGGCC